MTISVYVKPNSKKAPLIEVSSDTELTVYIREIAADGKANAALISLLAKYYGVPKSQVVIVRGHTARHKIIHIS